MQMNDSYGISICIILLTTFYDLHFISSYHTKMKFKVLK